MAATVKTIRFIRLPAVLAKVGLSRTQVYKMISDGQFPAQVRLSARTVAWLEDQVVDWMNQRLVEVC